MSKFKWAALFYAFIYMVNLRMASAQQRPQYTQYMLNNFMINPAVAGIENYVNVKLGSRNQWSGLEGAPNTSYLTVNAPIGDQYLDGDATSAPVDASNPMSRNYALSYQAAKPHHGIGLKLVSDKAGLINQTIIDASYAYHLGVSSNVNLAVGVSVGINHIGLNTADAVAGDPSDAAIFNSGNNVWRPEIGVGVWAYAASYYIGLSALQFSTKNYGRTLNADEKFYRTSPHVFFTTGYKGFLTDDISIMPSVLIKYVKSVPVSYDLNLKMGISDLCWFGASFRKNDSIAGLAGINLNSFLNVAYSYDASTSALRTVNTGSHEISIGIMLNNRYKSKCPEHTF
jgi:type IX secretion system PorP/SprF family membrane protein